MSNTDLQFLADKFYNQFITDESIIGFEGLLKSNGIGSKRRIRIRNLIYEKYGKEKLIKIYRIRLASVGGKSRIGHAVSDITKERIKTSNIRHWENNDERRELSRSLMIKNCLGKSHTEDTNKKRLQSRRNGKGWKPHTEKSKKKMSKTFYRKWKNGDYDNRAKSFSSKSQLELMDFIGHNGYTTESEYTISGKPYDIFIKEKNLIIEFNGTYWHLDPRVYSKDHYDKSRNITAGEIWDRDKEKLDVAKQRGYSVMVVWEKDWIECKDKVSYVKQILC